MRQRQFYVCRAADTPPTWAPGTVGVCCRQEALAAGPAGVFLSAMHWELLGGLPDDERQAVVAAMRTRRFPSGETVFAEGDAGDSVHFIAKGHVAVRITTSSGLSATLSILGPGQAFGEMALLRRSSRRTASVEAVDALETKVLHRDVFFRLAQQHPSVERLLIGLLAARVDRLSRHLLEALHLPVEQRLVRRLLETALLYDDDDGEGVVLPLTQDDVAQLTGTTRPTANAVLRELQGDGLIRLSRGRIRLLEPERLRRRAG